MDIKNQKGEILKAGCVVIDNHSRVLLVTNKLRRDWSYPKGHLEANEPLEQAAIRETLEETGYEVKIIKQLTDLTYINRQTNEPIRVSLYLATPIRQVSQHNDETSEWKNIEEAKKIVLPNLKPYLDNLK